MKKIVMLLAVITTCVVAWAKSPSPEELCASLNGLYEVDGSDVIVKKVIELQNMTKNDIYLLVQEYINKTYKDANSVIQVEDKESGRIIAKGCSKFGIGESFALASLHFTSWHIFKVDIKEGKVRITISSESTEYEQDASQYSSYRRVECALVKCYPIQDPGAYYKKHLDGYIFYHSVNSMINLMNDTELFLQKAQVRNASTDDEW